MKPILYKGQLTIWKDDRGFGFIKPDGGGKKVFLHISALKGVGRRPKTGDTILYEQVTEPDGKVRAAKAFIQGVSYRALPTNRKLETQDLLKTILSLVIFAGTVLFAVEFNQSRFPSPITAITKPGCTIKGNISVGTGNKVYHLPGMEDYESTVIDPIDGEKWFCTESEAIENGWRKAPR